MQGRHKSGCHILEAAAAAVTDAAPAAAARAKQLPGAIGPMPVLYISCRDWLVASCMRSWLVEVMETIQLLLMLHAINIAEEEAEGSSGG